MFFESFSPHRSASEKSFERNLSISEAAPGTKILLMQTTGDFLSNGTYNKLPEP